MNKVFLGGTCNNTTWREELIELLKVPYFNPVVENWTLECKALENKQKENDCNIHLYVITSEMTGVYSIAEAVESTMTNNKITLFSIIRDVFNEFQLKSLDGVCDIINKQGGYVYRDANIKSIAVMLNLLRT